MLSLVVNDIFLMSLQIYGAATECDNFEVAVLMNWVEY